jgi:aconitate decarboxylase
MAEPLTRQYAAFASAASRNGIAPGKAFEVVRLGFTDSAGVILAGLNEDVVKRLVRHVERQGGAETARLLFGQRRASPIQSALVNSTAAHAHDYDDFAFSNHPSAVLCPAILAAAEHARIFGRTVDGRRMANAYVAGYEIWAEVMKREPDHLYAKGWHPTAVFGPIGAAAAAAVVLDLDEGEILNAIALACSLAGGVFENFGTMAKPMHGGRASEAGVTAACMAAEGIAASPSAVEGKHGLLTGVSPNGRTDRDRPTRLGRDWHILKERLNIKKYPTVGASQRVIDAVLMLRRERPPEIGRIQKIVPRVSVNHLEVMPFHAPTTGLQAKFSLPFAVACALVHGRVGLAEVQDSVVREPRIQALMAMVEPETTREFLPDWPNAAPFDVVHFHLDDGSIVSTPEVRRATGHGDTPLSAPEIRAKFEACAAFGGVAPAPAAALFEAMQRIDALASPADIASVS